MARGRMTHDWDLFSLLICFVHNTHVMKEKFLITPDKVHPFLEAKAKPVKSFKRSDWLGLKALITRERS